MQVTNPSRRNRWLMADLACMQCGRTLGSLLGVGGTGRWEMFRPADATRPVRRLIGKERFRCEGCGGTGLVQEVTAFTTYNDGIFDDEQNPAPRRRGRPPKPLRQVVDHRLVQSGLAG